MSEKKIVLTNVCWKTSHAFGKQSELNTNNTDNTDNCHFIIKMVVFIDWLIYHYIDTKQRDGSYQIQC
jgi:hypothetical protein